MKPLGAHTPSKEGKDTVCQFPVTMTQPQSSDAETRLTEHCSLPALMLPLEAVIKAPLLVPQFTCPPAET